MRRIGLHLLLVLGLSLAFSGCTDTGTMPQGTTPGAAPGLTAVVVADSGDYQGPACCEKVIVTVPGPDPAECDPYTSLNWCDGGGDCMTTQPGTMDDPDSMTPSAGSTGCLPGGGGGTVPPGGGIPTPPPTVPQDTACKTESPALNDPAVQTGLKELWNQSGYSLEQQQRREAGAWIVRDASGAYRLAPLVDAVSTPCSINGNWNAPVGAVAFVHTHPFTSREVMTACGPITRRLADGREVPLVGKDGAPIYHRYGNGPSPAIAICCKRW
jgi:hypothetical protein